MKATKKMIAMLLVWALLLSGLPVVAAEGNSGCTHVHDGTCTYVEGADCAHVHDTICGYVDAAPCGHQHDESCGEDGAECAHAHDTECGYADTAPCGHAEHDAGCGYAVAVPCDHQHDGDCGGITPILSLGCSVTAFDSLPPDVAAQSVSLGTTMSALVLPDTLDATGEAAGAQPEDITIHGVTWQSAPDYEPDTAGTYSFTAELPQGYNLAGGVSLPVIEVTVEGAAQSGPSITFDIPLNDSNETAFYLPEKEPITEADLLAGVSAVDETGADVAVTVQDADGLDMDNPQMRGIYPNPPYIITYAAAHPVTGDVFTEKRELYVTLGDGEIKPAAGTYTANSYSDLQTEVVKTSGESTNDVIQLGQDITNGAAQLTIGRSLTLDLNGHNLTIILAYATGQTSNGIKIDSGVTLTIIDSSPQSSPANKLTVTNNASGSGVTGNGCGAGINTNGGTLIIESGTVEVKSGGGGAGIGGGNGENGDASKADNGTIIINGTANVTATSGTGGGAGIGGGRRGTGGNIEINGDAVVTATSVSDGGAGIGGGYRGVGGNITISGYARVTAACTEKWGAGIGGGDSRAGGNITIYGGTVYATGGTGAAGIGGGNSGAGGNITISGGTVIATGGEGQAGSIGDTGYDIDNAMGGGAGIGGGGSYQRNPTPGNAPASGNITISGDADVTATGGAGKGYTYSEFSRIAHAGAGIGTGGTCQAGTTGTLGTIDIDDSATVTANGGAGDSKGANDGADIGTGGDMNGPGEEIDPASAGNVCKIGDVEYETLAAALAEVEDDDTITLLDNIDYDTGILIENITVTFKLNGYDLNVVCDDKYNTVYGDALEVDGGTVILDDAGGGVFNVTSTVSEGAGLHVYNGGIATVTNAGCETDDDAYAVYAEDGAAVTVKGDVIAVGNYTCGVSAYYTTVIVNGNVSATSLGNGNVYGVDIAENSIVTVGGNVSATGKGDTYGVCANANSTVTVEGTITATTDGTAIYIRVGGTNKTIDEITTPTPQTGYFTYTDGTNTVLVRIPTVCKIGDVEYPTLEAAIAAVTTSTPTTIIILKDFALTDAVTIPANKNITIESDTGGSFTITAASGKRHLDIEYNDNTTNVTLKNIILDGGNTGGGNSGGGIYNDGNLTLGSGGIVQNCSAEFGGGVLNYGTLTIGSGGIVQNCSAEFGGGINNYGTLTLDSGAIVQYCSADYGGGIINYVTLTLGSGAVVQNCSAENGGGIENGGSLTVNGTISGNIATNTEDYGGGGGIFNQYGTVTIEESGVVTGNTASYGGDIYNSGGLNNSTVIIIGTVGDIRAVYDKAKTYIKYGSTVNGSISMDGGGMNYFEVLCTAGTGGTLNSNAAVTYETGTYAVQGGEVAFTAAPSGSYQVKQWTQTDWRDSETPTNPSGTSTTHIVSNLQAPVKAEVEFEAIPIGFDNKILSDGTYDAAYSDNVDSATGGSGTFTYSATVPAGLTMSSGGAITGTPDAVVTAQTFTVTATDTTTGATKDATYTITINRATYTGTATKEVSIQTDQPSAQTGTLTAADFFTDVVPTGANIKSISQTTEGNVVKTIPGLNSGTLSYTSEINISEGEAGSVYSVIIETDGYDDITATLIFKAVSKIDVGGSISFSDGSATYNGLVQTHETASFMGTPSGTGGFTYTYTAGTGTLEGGKPKGAGTYTVTATYEDDTQKGSEDATFTISPKTVTVAAGSYTVTKVYDGTISAGTGSGDLSVTGILAADSDVTVPAVPRAYSASDVGSSYTVTVDLSLTGTGNENYTLASTTVDVPGTITQAVAPSFTWPTAAAITYGQTLANSTLSPAFDAYGTFAWTNPATAPTVAQSGNGFSVTYTPSDTANYDYSGVTLTHDVSVTVNPKNLSDVTISATWPTLTYNGSAQEPTPSSVTFDSVSVAAGTDYTLGTWADNINVGTTAKVTFTGAGNYTGTQVVNFTIAAADYTYTVAEQNIKQGSQISAIIAPTTGTGVNSETVSGTLTWYASSADAASGTSPLQSTDATQFNEEIDSTKTLYWRFVASDTNYSVTAKTGSTLFAIVDGDPQDITFPSNTATATYGDAPSIIQIATNNSSDSAITYRSDNTAVATVADDGTVTIVGAGTAVIYAKAAAVPGTWAETEVSYTLTVNPKDVAITSAAITDKVYDGTSAIDASTVTPTFDDAGIGSYYTVSAASVTGGNYSVGNNKPTTFTVTLTGTVAQNYNLTNAIYTAATVNITARPLTITGVTATNRAYDDGNTAVTLTGGALQNVAAADAGDTSKLSFALDSGTITNDEVGNDKAVTTNITLTGTSAGNYTLTQPTGITVNITAANQATLTIDDPGAKTYGDAPFPLTTTGGNGTGAVSFTVISGPGSINGDTLTITGAGSIVVTATKAADGNYNATTSAELTIEVSKANQATLSVTAVTGKKFGDTPFALATTGGDGTGAVSFTVISGPGSISGNILTITGVGNIIVTATKAADDNYEATTSAQQTITIAKGDAPSITWPTASGVNYGDALSASTLSFTSNAYGTFAWTTPTTIPTVTNSGYSVTFTPSADTLANYEAISPLTNTVSVTVTPKNVSALTIEAIATVTYTGSAHEPSLTVKDGGTELSAPGDYTVSYSNNTAAGTATVTIMGAGNYTGTKQTTFTIKKAIPATLSWPTAGNITYGAALLTSNLTGGSTTGAWAWTSGTMIPPAGTYTYEVTFTPNDTVNYDWSNVTLTQQVTITVNQSTALSVTTQPSMNAKEGTARDYSFDMNNIALNHADTGAKSYSAVEGTDSNGILSNVQVNGDELTYDIAAAALAGNTATITITITSANYTDVTATLTITVTAKDTQTIAFSAPTQTKTYGDAKFAALAALVGNGGSGEITYASDNTAVATVDYATGEVTIVGAGSANITATKAEDNDWFEATATYGLNVNMKTVTVTAENKTAKVDAAEPTYTYTHSGFVGSDTFTTTPSVTCPTANMSTPGTYPIVPSGAAASANYIISYANGTLTVNPLSTACGVTSVSSPSGATISGTNITATVDNSVSSQLIALNISADATWKLYSDAACTSEITSKTMPLAEGANTAYIKVTAEDGIAYQIYAIAITRSAAARTITASAGTGGTITPSGTVSVVMGGSRSFTITPNNGYRIANVLVDGVSVGAVSNYTFSNVTANHTISASFSYYGGGGGNGGGDSTYTPTPSVPITTDKQPNMPTLAKVGVKGTVKDNVLSAIITEKMAKDAIAAAGSNANGIAIQFDVTGSGDYVSLSATFERKALEALKAAGVKYVQIGSTLIDLTLDTKAITEILSQTTGNVTISAVAQSKLSDAAKRIIGSRPVFDITIKDAKGTLVSNLKTGTITIGIYYKPASWEKKGNLFGVYVDGNGKPQLLTSSSYDNGKVIFGRGTLSVYGVGYKTPAPAYADTKDHWAKEDIDFVASRELISGTSATLFSPNTNITRADFLMALGKLSGADVSGYKTSSFTDVANGNPAMPYIEWAVKNGIVQGIGNNKFAPASFITREQMAVMMVNYAKVTNYTLPVSRQAVTFADNAKISSWSKDAVKAIQQAGIIVGKPNNLYDPQGNATRAEASAILHRFIELVIDEGTARGWVQNDAGQWQYINTNGRAVTGWLSTTAGSKYWFDDKGIMVSGKWIQIGGKWYYFYSDGKLAINTTIDGHTIGEDGARK